MVRHCIISMLVHSYYKELQQSKKWSTVIEETYKNKKEQK